MRIKIVICFAVLIVNCKNSKDLSSSKTDNFQKENFCDLIEKLIKDDQKYRSMVQDPFFRILDSIRMVNDLTEDEYDNLPREDKLEYGAIARVITDKTKSRFTEEQKDSIMVLQKNIDHKNTKALIEIVEKRGFPNKENSKCDGNPGVIFMHSPEIYADSIKTLLKVELNKGNIPESNYNLLLWHLNGRKGLPVQMN